MALLEKEVSVGYATLSRRKDDKKEKSKKWVKIRNMKRKRAKRTIAKTKKTMMVTRFIQVLK